MSPDDLKRAASGVLKDYQRMGLLRDVTLDRVMELYRQDPKEGPGALEDVFNDLLHDYVSHENRPAQNLRRESAAQQPTDRHWLEQSLEGLSQRVAGLERVIERLVSRELERASEPDENPGLQDERDYYLKLFRERPYQHVHDGMYSDYLAVAEHLLAAVPYGEYRASALRSLYESREAAARAMAEKHPRHG